ncbi:DUF4241 domain-containing protein [Mucilaginibacter terrenus]|uniref:DUF4241 domain-containing protein n=1 Tax=Mucilaginibacter terrenus TaxID=2482727 RepID=A0A3E2NTF1_9SPHI|nr:DUF4241 domain-containing protein [Mucilaginibacter terrenus]RFZ84249.1 DUF4241 domain-containing protein [Mucilaginibacter terrenus]
MKPIYLITLITFVTCACNNPQFDKSRPNGNYTADTVKKKIVQQEILSPVDYNQVFEKKIAKVTPIKLLEIGDLNIPTGKIVACDPLVALNFTPFNKTVKPGVYPVKIYVAKTKESGERYAVAKLEFSHKKAVKWVLALHDGENTSELKDPDDYFGFPVDAGLAAFFDYKTGLAYGKFVKQFQQQHPKGNIYIDYLEAEFKKHAKKPGDDGDWINMRVPNSDLNITMFRSGYGDGSYPAYWGMTENNEIVSLIIDFLVLPLSK